ncbi:hypothetical protein ILUMI_26690 [Ignelater luminosus]|uniref:Uncharacterized protein n=1 Tax=Ignelater luminosus TaxID=2038154 RepID=A0A8K0FYF0_IGNLU|nr:hypothetical protein ILUMI_26690 [Ignelater luminosus]
MGLSDRDAEVTKLAYHRSQVYGCWSQRDGPDKPDIGHDMTHDKFINWKSHLASNMTIRKADTNGKLVSWQKMCWLDFSKERPFVMRFKESFGQEFKSLDCTKKNYKKQG